MIWLCFNCMYITDKPPRMSPMIWNISFLTLRCHVAQGRTKQRRGTHPAVTVSYSKLSWLVLMIVNTMLCIHFDQICPNILISSVATGTLSEASPDRAEIKTKLCWDSHVVGCHIMSSHWFRLPLYLILAYIQQKQKIISRTVVMEKKKQNNYRPKSFSYQISVIPWIDFNTEVGMLVLKLSFNQQVSHIGVEAHPGSRLYCSSSTDH